MSPSETEVWMYKKKCAHDSKFPWYPPRHLYSPSPVCLDCSNIYKVREQLYVKMQTWIAVIKSIKSKSFEHFKELMLLHSATHAGVKESNKKLSICIHLIKTPLNTKCISISVCRPTYTLQPFLAAQALTILDSEIQHLKCIFKIATSTLIS